MMQPAPDIVTAAKSAQMKWRVPACVSIAQWALESGWGVHSPGNNPFGIKALPGFDSQFLMTHECVNGHSVPKLCPFAKFDSIGQAFDAHAKLLATAPVYAAAFKVNSIEAFVSAIAPHYATDPQYAAKVMAVIDGSNLTQYDTEAL